MKKDSIEVLVIEDDSMTSSVILEFMTLDEIPAEIAHSFHDALQKFKHKNYRVVILDNKLGDGEGIALCELFKEISPTVTMFLFAGDSESVKKKALALGVREVLQKASLRRARALASRARSRRPKSIHAARDRPQFLRE